MFVLAFIYDSLYRASLNRANWRTHAIMQSLPVVAFLLSLTYILTEGYRYARGVDMLGNYGPFYLHCMEPAHMLSNSGLYLWITRVFYYVDITRGIFPFGSIFVFYAFIFWICLWYFYKDYRKNSVGFLLFAILANLSLTESTIRQGVSFSIVYLGLYFLERKKFLYVIGCAFAAFMIHNGNVIALVVIGFSWFCLNKKPFSWKMVVPIFIVLEYTAQFIPFTSYIQQLISLSGLSTGEHFEGYMNTEYTDYEAEVASEWQRGVLTQLITIAFYSSLLVIGSITQRYKKCNVYIFNAFVVGILFYEPFRLSGSFARMFMPLAALWFVPLSLGLYYRNKLNMSSKEKNLVKYCIYIVIAYIVMFYGRYVFLNPEATYVWNVI